VSPAIYQLQSEVSTFPSSPLARFPSSSLDLERAAKHMRFLWSDQVLIRNDATLKAFLNSKDFTLQASAPPFSVFKLKQFDTHLVDVLQVPLQWHAKKNWMETSFQWFNARQNFEKYVPVFHDGEAPKNIQAAPTDARIDKLTMDRTHIAWTTNAVNTAQLVRMTWHTKWRLATKGKLYLAGPGFMLVVPEEENVRLEYTDTTVGLWGMGASILAFVVFVFMCVKRRLGVSEHSQALTSSAWPVKLNGLNLVWLWPLILIATGLWFHLNNPERVYTQAWVAMRAGNYAGAAPQFDSAFEGRKSNAKKEEALFWAAKAYQQSQQDDKALQRFEMLTTGYHGFWLPESLFTHAELADKKGQSKEAQALRRRLIDEYPQDRWTQKLAPQK
jgi:tetratricopeptide (TPR) repeat protein